MGQVGVLSVRVVVRSTTSCEMQYAVSTGPGLEQMGEQTPTGVGETPTVDVDGVMREVFLSTHSLMCFEVALPFPDSNEYTILEIGQGAQSLLSHAPWGNGSGSNLLYFIHHDDADRFTHFLQAKARQELFADVVKREALSAVEMHKLNVRMKRFFKDSLRSNIGSANGDAEGGVCTESRWSKGNGADSAPNSLAFPQLLADDPLLEDISSQDSLLNSVKGSRCVPGGPNDVLSTVAGDFRAFACYEYIHVQVSVHFPTRNTGAGRSGEGKDARHRALLLVEMQPDDVPPGLAAKSILLLLSLALSRPPAVLFV